MTLASRFSSSSVIYTLTNLIQSGIGFLLLPLYTRYLGPHDYGILAVVTSINAFLSVLLTLSMHGAMTRFYFEYRQDPQKLKVFWGTILTAILLLSFGIGGGLLLFGRQALWFAIGDISFWPYIGLGIMTVMLQPFFTIYLSLLQTQEKSLTCAILSLGSFCLRLGLILVLVIGVGWKAEGPITANLVTAIIFFIVSLYALRKEITPGIEWESLKESLHYSLPLVPHSLSAQISSMADRILLNNLIGTATAGLYNVGYLFGSILLIMVDSINRAYVPISMDVLKSEDPTALEELKQIGLFLTTFYCLMGSVISLFSPEIIRLFTVKAFFSSYTVVPFIAFASVISGFYYLLVNILFYAKQGTKFVAIGTGLGAVLNLLLNWYWIPHFGLVGAANATLVSQVLVTLAIALLGYRYEKIDWPYLKIVCSFILSFAISLSILWIQNSNFVALILIKALAFVFLFLVLNTLVWQQPLYMLVYGYQIIKTLKKRK